MEGTWATLVARVLHYKHSSGNLVHGVICCTSKRPPVVDKIKKKRSSVEGTWATLVARVLHYALAAPKIPEPEHNDATSDSELQSSDSEDPDHTKDDAQSDSSEMGDFQSNIVTLCARHWCRMRYSTKQVKDLGIFTPCRWWLRGWVRHNFWVIWKGVRANLPLLRGGEFA